MAQVELTQDLATYMLGAELHAVQTIIEDVTHGKMLDFLSRPPDQVVPTLKRIVIASKLMPILEPHAEKPMQVAYEVFRSFAGPVFDVFVEQSKELLAQVQENGSATLINARDKGQLTETLRKLQDKVLSNLRD